MAAKADEYVTNLGPVGPNEPIIAALGRERVIAFFVPERGSCAIHAFMWKDAGADAPYSTSRVRVSLRPGEMARFDASHMSMNLRRCLNPGNRGPSRVPYGSGANN